MTAARRLPQAPTDLDRRGALRHPVEVEGQLSTSLVAHGSVVLTDISEQGCQIVRPEGLTRDSLISLSFGGFTPFTAAVVWTSPEAAGLRLEHRIHPALIAQVVTAARGRRRPQRQLGSGLVRHEDRERLWHPKLPVLLAIEEGSPDRPPAMLNGELCDLSTHGCRITSNVALLPETMITVEVEDNEVIAGIVRWCVTQAIGVEFYAALPPRTIESIAQRAIEEAIV